MGPGFDSFGFAVDLENELILERGATADITAVADIVQCEYR